MELDGVEKRTKEIKVRLTVEEFDRLNAIKTKPQLAVWIRELALNPTTDMFTKSFGRQSVLKLDDDIERQLAIANNNLNQVARALNTLVSTGKADALSTVIQIAEVEAIGEVIEEIFKVVKIKTKKIKDDR